MSEIPDDIMQIATEIVDRIAKQHVWKGDCIADVAGALLAERQRSASLKALCDEMAKALEGLADLTPAQANAATSRDLHLHVKAIANEALAAYRKEKEVGNG